MFVALDIMQGRIKTNEYGALYVDHNCYVVRGQIDEKYDINCLNWKIIGEFKTRKAAERFAKGYAKGNGINIIYNRGHAAPPILLRKEAKEMEMLIGCIIGIAITIISAEVATIGKGSKR